MWLIWFMLILIVVLFFVSMIVLDFMVWQVFYVKMRFFIFLLFGCFFEISFQFFVIEMMLLGKWFVFCSRSFLEIRCMFICFCCQFLGSCSRCRFFLVLNILSVVGLNEGVMMILVKMFLRFFVIFSVMVLFVVIILLYVEIGLYLWVCRCVLVIGLRVFGVVVVMLQGLVCLMIVMVGFIMLQVVCRVVLVLMQLLYDIFLFCSCFVWVMLWLLVLVQIVLCWCEFLLQWRVVRCLVWIVR